MKTKVTITASISDDDLCSNCIFCNYIPGEESSCHVDFRCAMFDLDSYVINCKDFNQIEEEGAWTDK